MAKRRKPSGVTVAMLGARMSYAVPRLLARAGLLHRLYTDSYGGNKAWLRMIESVVSKNSLPHALQRLMERKADDLPPNKVTSFERLGARYYLARKASRQRSRRAVYRDVSRRFVASIVRKKDWSEMLWAYNGAAGDLFREAKANGVTCILEQCSNPRPIETQLAREESQRRAGWTRDTNAKDDEDLEDYWTEEWRLADRIVCGSQFVADGLEKCGVTPSKVEVVPYGIDLDMFPWSVREPARRDAPLKLLFVGRVSVMKGVPDLLEALLELGPDLVQGQFVGEIQLAADQLARFRSVAQFTGPVVRSQTIRYYQSADVFCFPSITEGSATVTYEALASGLPVITTPNSGSLVRHGVDGFIVPIRDPISLARAIHEYCSRRELVDAHRAATFERRQIAGLPRYESDLIRIIRGNQVSSAR